MKNDRSKDRVELLGEYLRDRKPSSEEEKVVLDHVWQEMRSELDSKTLPPRAPQKPSISRFVWAGAVAAAVIAAILFGISVRKVSPALVASTEGKFERVHEDNKQLVRPGEKLAFDEVIRTGAKARTVLTPNDGSQIEMRSNSALVLEKADDGVRIRLANGGVFITAAKQRRGHLYVQTKDVTVSVQGNFG